jgi:hypothetical protein
MRVRQRSRYRFLPLSQNLPTNAVDTRRQSGRCYIITSDVVGQVSEFPGRGACWHEVVPVEHQTGLAARALGAGGSVCCRVRTFPLHHGAGRARDSVGLGAVRIFFPATAGFRSRSAAGRHLRDLRRDGTGEQRFVRNAAATTASASRGIFAPRRRRRVRASELGSRRLSASRSPHLLISMIDDPHGIGALRVPDSLGNSWN